MLMHMREQIKTKPLIVPNIDDNPMPRNIDKNAVTKVEALLTVPTASTTYVNSWSSFEPLNCLGIVLSSGVLDN